MIFKMFKQGVGSSDLLEKDVNAFLTANPDLVPTKFQMNVYYGIVYVGILFSDNIPVQLPRQVDTVPAPWIPPTEITCEDPWQGEFIPVGDPPMDVPQMGDPPCPSRRRFQQMTQGKAGFGSTI